MDHRIGQHGQPQLGLDGPTLLIFPGAGGSMTALGALVARLSPATALTQIIDYRDAGETMSADFDVDGLIDQLASRAIRAGQRVWLLGYSLGGALAVEVASRMAARGSPAEWIGVIDGRVPARNVSLPRVANSSLSDWISRFGPTAGAGLRFGLLEQWARECAAGLTTALMRRERYELVGLLFRLSCRLGFERLSRRIFASAAAVQHYKVFLPYPLSRVSQTLWLFTSNDIIYDRERYPDLGWGSLCDDLRICSVGAGHFSIIQPPDVDTLAPAILSTTMSPSAKHHVVVHAWAAGKSVQRA